MAERSSPRVVWKGAVVFGLVHVPVTLRAASREVGLDFDWLDKRDMAPVGYQRINKTTGESVDREFIVKGYAFEKGNYVVLSDADFKAANPEATQTVEIVSFAKGHEISPAFYVTPYFLEPGPRAEKGYILLRDTLAASKRVGIASLVIHNKQRLAVVYPDGDLLRLNTLRFSDELLDADAITPPKVTGRGNVLAREREMASRLIEDMSEPFDHAQYRDTYRDDLLARIDKKVKSGQTHVLAADADAESAPRGAQVIDLMEALRRSLKDGSRTRPQTAGRSNGRAATDHQAANDDEARPKRAAKRPTTTAGRRGRPSNAAARRTPAARKRA